jgi:hypothetical protein
MILQGVAVSDDGLLVQTRSVLAVSTLMAMMAIGVGIAAIWLRDAYSLTQVMAVVIPVVGLMAVRKNSHALARAFSLCNGLCVGIYAATAVLTLSTTLPFIDCLCDVACATAKLPPTVVNASEPIICPRKQAVKSGYIVSLALGAAMAALQCAGWYAGKRLASNVWFLRGPLPVGVPVMGSGSLRAVQPTARSSTSANAGAWQQHGGAPSGAGAGGSGGATIQHGEQPYRPFGGSEAAPALRMAASSYPVARVSISVTTAPARETGEGVQPEA